jgi:dTDP-4-dehydrorhamnose 3,5-epimerase
MTIIETYIPDLFVIEPKIFEDQRGYFFESYNEETYRKNGINAKFVQDNESKSSYGVLRGLHYQLAPYAQTKLVRVVEGEVFDVAVDLRKNSPTFGKWYGIVLSVENKKQFYIPQGFAHGFAVLSPTAVFSYKCDSFYNPQAERGILYNDDKLGIDWKIDLSEDIVSPKDKIHPNFEQAEINFSYSR